MTMHRSWIVWLVSSFTFCVTVAVIIATGPSQNANSRDVKAQPEESAVGAVKLPKMNTQDSTETASREQINSAPGDSAPNLSAQGSSSQSNALSDSSSTAAQSAGNDQAPAANKTGLTKGGRHAALSAAKASAAKASPTATPETTTLAQAQAVVGISYQPEEVVALAHPSNYGERYVRDANGNAVDNDYIVVLHETVGSASSALNTFQTNHPRDEDQVSYHTLIGLSGTIYYVVPPEQRAFGAGDSVFKSFQGEESVFTNAEFPSSVNNFAYHISLETPLDGQNNNSTYHSGYTEAQYKSLAWLLARTNIPDDRITTHRTVDRSGSRMDPRSFEADRMFRLLRQYPSRQQAG